MKKTKKKRGNLAGYAERNKRLSIMGFKGYSEYLRSGLWSKIRRRVLKRDQYKCVPCGKPATDVHHTSYEESVLRGENDMCLLSVCSPCHLLIEFDDRNNKVSFEDAVARTSLLLRGELRRSPSTSGKKRRGRRRGPDAPLVATVKELNDEIALVLKKNGRSFSVILSPDEVADICAVLAPYNPPE